MNPHPPNDIRTLGTHHHWLFTHDPRYARHWGGTEEEIRQAAKNRESLPEHQRKSPHHVHAERDAKILAELGVKIVCQGPGTELKRLIDSLGIEAKLGCGCEALARQMDQWGPEGCAQRRDEILAKLRENASKLGWLEKIKAAANAVLTGLAFQLDMSDPAASLLDEAICRARAQAASAA